MSRIPVQRAVVFRRVPRQPFSWFFLKQSVCLLGSWPKKERHFLHDRLDLVAGEQGHMTGFLFVIKEYCTCSQRTSGLFVLHKREKTKMHPLFGAVFLHHDSVGRFGGGAGYGHDHHAKPR